MTREEAIQILSTRDWSGMLCGYTGGYTEALDMAIEALSKPIVDITQRDLCKDISCEDCPFMNETCKLMDYVAYADRPHGEWIADTEKMTINCPICGEKFGFDDVDEMLDYKEYAHFCIHCGADTRGWNNDQV